MPWGAVLPYTRDRSAPCKDTNAYSISQASLTVCIPIGSKWVALVESRRILRNTRDCHSRSGHLRQCSCRIRLTEPELTLPCVCALSRAPIRHCLRIQPWLGSFRSQGIRPVRQMRRRSKGQLYWLFLGSSVHRSVARR